MPAEPQMGAEIAGSEFVLIFGELGPKLLNMLLCLLGNHADAQDAMQDAFLKCWRTRGSSGGVRDLRAWIFRVVVNAARDRQRSAWRRRIRPLEEHASWHSAAGATPAQAAEENERLDLLRHAIMKLRVEERAVFLLRQNDQLPYREIARRRNSPVGTVKTQMRRALVKLRLALRSVHAD